MADSLDARHTLADLAPGQVASVLDLACTGAERRRLMDLGILPGTRIEAEMRSPLGDPVAYRVRGSIIALRKAQAREIHVSFEDVQEQKGSR